MISALSELSTALFFVSAMCLAGFVHVWWLKSRFCAPWRLPIDGGKRVRGRRVFGDNKMWRGFMVLPVAAAVSFPLLFILWPDKLSASNYPFNSTYILQISALGFASGFGFMLGELPNSFIKRQLDIAPGMAPTSPVLRIVFVFIDRVDSTIVALLFAGLVVPLSAFTCIWVLVLGFVLHALFSAMLHKVGVKNRAL